MFRPATSRPKEIPSEYEVFYPMVNFSMTPHTSNDIHTSDGWLQRLTDRWVNGYHIHREIPSKYEVFYSIVKETALTSN